MNFVAIITARGGSKGLPGKNLRTLAGRPLIAHTIAAATGCPLVAATCVTTDDALIAQVAREAGVAVIDRPAALATDTATSGDAVRHALETLAVQGQRFDAFCLLQPTSPLRTAAHLGDCIAAFQAGAFASAISVCEAEHHPWKMLRLEDGLLHPFAGQAHLSAPRQSLPRVMRQNGAIYLMRCRDFLDNDGSFFREPAMAFPMSHEDSIDIDVEFDLLLAESVLRKRAGD